MHSDNDKNWDSIREKIIGLGEQSIRKSYYPELQQRISELERFRALLDETNDVIFLIEVHSGKLADFNISASEKLGYSPQKLSEMSVHDIISPDEIEGMKHIIDNLVKGRKLKNRLTVETFLKRQDNSQINVEINISLVRFSDDAYIVMVARDITERKAFENALKSSIKEKEVLIREIHHRVKNNMQIISSLLNLQHSFVEDEEIKTILKDSQSRVKSMALVHEKLYQTDDLAEINAAEYIRSLTTSMFNNYSVQPGVELILDVGEVFFDIDTAVPMGLVINELVSNSLKYAFPDDKTGKIYISLQKSSEERKYILKVEDDGVGFPEDIDFLNSRSLGLQLVKTLVDQLNGTVELDCSNGTSFKINIKQNHYTKRI